MPLEFLNHTENTGAFSFSPDMSYAVYTACNKHDAVGGCDLYFISGNKSYNLGPVVNSENGIHRRVFLQMVSICIL